MMCRSGTALTQTLYFLPVLLVLLLVYRAKPPASGYQNLPVVMPAISWADLGRTDLKQVAGAPVTIKAVMAETPQFQFNEEWFKKVGELAHFYNAANTDLHAFEKHGGKLILWHGGADTSQPLATTIAYYQELQIIPRVSIPKRPSLSDRTTRSYTSRGRQADRRQTIDQHRC